MPFEKHLVIESFTLKSLISNDALHGVRLAGWSLSVCKNRSIVATQNV